MTAFEVEEEIDILSSVIDTLNTNMSYLEAVSFKDGRYNLLHQYVHDDTL